MSYAVWSDRDRSRPVFFDLLKKPVDILRGDMMRKHSSPNSQVTELTITIPCELQQLHLKEARTRMRQFGRGLGKGHPPHNGARRHDDYLYDHK